MYWRVVQTPLAVRGGNSGPSVTEVWFALLLVMSVTMILAVTLT